MAIYDSGYVLTFDDGLGMLVDSFTMAIPKKFRFYVVKDEENLLSISSKFFKNSSLWYVIAEMNPGIDIFNPVPGSSIKIPHV